jgi:hypothetical protein
MEMSKYTFLVTLAIGAAAAAVATDRREAARRVADRTRGLR